MLVCSRNLYYLFHVIASTCEAIQLSFLHSKGYKLQQEASIVSKNQIINYKPSTISGFSLIEAMVATMIISIAFVGVFSLTTFSAKQIVNSQDRQKLQLVANQIFEIIEIDSDNIASYATNLATCTTPGSGEARKYILRPYEWCTRLNAELGTAQTSDVRTITVTASGSENIVTVTLTSKNGANKVILKRTYD